MKIVIVSQNCYPYISPRANRATELAKEFACQGHEVILYALLGNLDYSQFEIKTGVKVKSLGVSRLGLFNNENKRRNNILLKVLKRLFGRILNFPKIELASMTNRVLKCERTMDLLITIAQPHAIHWGGAKFRRNNRKAVGCWIADCGDPFMLNPFVNYPWYFKYVEKEWCNNCDYIAVPIESAKEAYYPEFLPKIIIIPQGFDFSVSYGKDYHPNVIPTFAYSGLFYVDKRDPLRFLDYLCTLKQDFRFVVYTNDNQFYAETFHFEEYKKALGDKLIINPFIPHEELMIKLSQMDFLINIKNNSGVQQPSKLIDYALSGRPILEISSSFAEKEAFEEFIQGDYHQAVIVENINQYDIKNVVKSMLALAK